MILQFHVTTYRSIQCFTANGMYIYIYFFFFQMKNRFLFVKIKTSVYVKTQYTKGTYLKALVNYFILFYVVYIMHKLKRVAYNKI